MSQNVSVLRFEYVVTNVFNHPRLRGSGSGAT